MSLRTEDSIARLLNLERPPEDNQSGLLSLLEDYFLDDFPGMETDII